MFNPLNIFYAWLSRSKFPVEPVNSNTMPEAPQSFGVVTLDKFTSLTSVVIDNFEGGYYHPEMLPNFKPSDQAKLKASGETMFGLDRKHGSQLAKYTEWGVFWSLVDKDRAENKSLWRYQYRGGKVAPRLKELTSQIMFKWFNTLAKKYILLGSMDEIANDDRLIIHFSYGAWNGSGWFQKFATALNSAVTKFPDDKEAIFKEAIKARTESPNKVIRQQGANMMALFKRMGLV